jgi:sugar lactone lactonase YvrE
MTRLLAIALLVGCTGPATGPDTDTTGPTPTPPTEDTAPVVPTADTAPPVPTADTAPPIDCSVPPSIPTPFITGQGFGTAEDFDITFDGLHVSAPNGNLITYDPSTGGTQLVSPNVGGTACTRMLPDGDFVYCDVGNNALVRVDAQTGAKAVLSSGFEYPNGGDVDPDGFVYVAEQSAGRVRRVDSATGDATIIANGLNNPNGVIWGPGYQTLYVGSFGGGTVWAIDRLGPDTFDTPRVFFDGIGTGGLDGINVDICGNVYVTDFGPGIVYRILADGSAIGVAANLPSTWIPNMRWGNGVNGWNPETLYVSDRTGGRMFGLQIGLPAGNPSFTAPP